MKYKSIGAVIGVVIFLFSEIIFAQKRVLVLPFRGRGGVFYRNLIMQAIGDRVEVIGGGRRDRRRIVSAIKRTEADFVVNGIVRCRKRLCWVTIEILNSEGVRETKRSFRTRRALVKDKIIKVTEELLEEVGAFETEEEMKEGRQRGKR